MQVVSPTGSLRLPVAQVTVLLGPCEVRRHVLAMLDEATARMGCGSAASVVRLDGRGSFSDRLRAVNEVGQAQLVLVDRLTDGLDPSDHRVLLTALRALALRGPAVLVDDRDPVAALALADGALRASADGSVRFETLALPEVP